MLHVERGASARLMRRDFAGALAAGAIVALFCLVLLWHDPLLFWNDDYQLSILPAFADVARSWSEGDLPLLSPYSWVCGNLAGEYQYGTFSVFVNAAVVLIWKFPLTFPQQAAALSITHLFVLAMGGYLLARGRNSAPPFALLVALVAALNGWIISWGATDWFGALAAFTWLPWAWWGMERALDPRRGKWRWVWPVPFVYLLATGGFPYTVLMLALLVAWLAVRTAVESRNIFSLWPLAIGALLGFGIAAPAWLALLDHVRGSAREVQQASSHLQWRVPFAAWPALIFPNWTVRWYDFSTRLMAHSATELACGSIPALALLAGMLRAPKCIWPRLKWELVLILIAALIAMLPSAGVFRWSFRWLPLLHLVVALCAAEVFQLLPAKKVSPLAAVLTCALAGVMWIIGAQGPRALPFVFVTIAIAVAWAVIDLVSSAGNKWLPAALTFAALLATYLCIPPNCGVPRYNLSQQLLEPAPLDRARLYLSIYPYPEFSYRVEAHPAAVGQELRPGSTSLWARLRFVTGYSPIRPAGVARLFNTGIHGQVDYDVASYMLNRQAGSHGELQKLGVDGIVVANQFNLRPQPDAEWQKVLFSQDAVVYHRAAASPVARAFWDEELIRADEVGALRVVEDSRNKIVLDYNGDREDELPVFIAVSRPFFHGYAATAGQQSLTVGSYRGLLPLIALPPGFNGRLSLSYIPAWLVWGGVIAAACALVWLAGVIAAAAPQYTSRL